MQLTQARPAVGLRQDESEPAELRDLLPKRRVVTVGRLGEPAYLRDRATLLEEASCSLAENLVLLAETEVCGDLGIGHWFYLLFGRPSTRSPRMLRWISLVPPPIVIPKEFR